MLVKDLMTISLSVISPDDRISAAVRIMRSENVGIVPVCDVQKHILGVVTDRDIIVRTQTNPNPAVSSLMSTDIISADAKDDIHDAAVLMAKHAVHRLPVLENGKLVGMLSLKDLAKKRIFIAEIGHVIYELSNRNL